MKVSLSNVDRGIFALNTYNNYKNRKVNEKILKQQKQSNKHLSQMQKELAAANATSKRILQNQIKEIEKAEEQKYYKALSFHTFELISEVSKTDDKIVLSYVMDNFYPKLKSDLLACNDVLDEINDKVFNKKSIEKLYELKRESQPEFSTYEQSVLAKIDKQLADFNTRQKEVLNIEKPKFYDQRFKVKSKTNVLRIIGIIILSILTFIFSITLLSIFSGETAVFFTGLVMTLIFGIPLFFLIRSELKWRKNYEQYKLSLADKQKVEKERKLKFEEEHQQLLEERKSILLDDPIYESMKIIQEKYPTFEIVTNNVNELSSTFYAKWED